VYEHIVFDGRVHHSVLAYPELRERSVAVFSFGKTLHATGLRVGYAVAPPELTAELRKVHQFNTFTIATALQQAIALYLEERPDCGEDLGAFFTAKRDLLVTALEGSGLVLPRAEGSFFQLIDYGALSRAPDVDFAEQLLVGARVASIPLSVFYQDPPPMTLLRLCIAKRDETLREGAARLIAYLRGAAAA
jgi:methionine aminotransferase